MQHAPIYRSKRPLTRNCDSSINGNLHGKIEMESHCVEDELDSESFFYPMGAGMWSLLNKLINIPPELSKHSEPVFRLLTQTQLHFELCSKVCPFLIEAA